MSSPAADTRKRRASTEATPPTDNNKRAKSIKGFYSVTKNIVERWCAFERNHSRAQQKVRLALAQSSLHTGSHCQEAAQAAQKLANYMLNIALRPDGQFHETDQSQEIELRAEMEKAAARYKEVKSIADAEQTEKGRRVQAHH